MNSWTNWLLDTLALLSIAVTCVAAIVILQVFA